MLTALSIASGVIVALANTVATGYSPEELRAAGHGSGHLCLVVRGPAVPEGLVHIRDVLPRLLPATQRAS